MAINNATYLASKAIISGEAPIKINTYIKPAYEHAKTVTGGSSKEDIQKFVKHVTKPAKSLKERLGMDFVK